MKAAAHPRHAADVPMPLTWAFDGRYAQCLADAEDTLRRAIVQVGDVSRVLIAIDLCLPALKARAASGERLQPAWGAFLDRVSTRYGLPAPRIRYVKDEGPLLALVIAYRS
jgi:hypothetical protein